MITEVLYYTLYLFAFFLGVIVTVRHTLALKKIKSTEVKILRSLMIRQSIGFALFLVANLSFAILAVFKTQYDSFIFPVSAMSLLYYSYQTDKLTEYYKHD